jgi:hypothetical protein
MPNQAESELATAARHVASGRLIVARQKARMAKLKAEGHATLDHEQTLQVFESTLRLFEDHERQLQGRRAFGDGSAWR